MHSIHAPSAEPTVLATTRPQDRSCVMTDTLHIGGGLHDRVEVRPG